MLVRGTPTRGLGGEDVIVISSTVEQAITFVHQQMHALLHPWADVVLNVTHCPDRIPTSAFDSLRTVGDIAIPLAHHSAEPDGYYQAGPRCSLVLAGTTSTGIRVDGRTVPLWEMRIAQRWEIVACPAGVDPRAHEIAETLLWDAYHAGDDLSETQAHAIASALLSA